RRADDLLRGLERADAIFVGGRELRELHEVAVTKQERDFGQGDPFGLRLLERREDLVGRRFEAVEAVARTQILAERIARSIEVVDVALRREKPGMTNLVELLERDLPRRTRR